MESYNEHLKATSKKPYVDKISIEKSFLLISKSENDWPTLKKEENSKIRCQGMEVILFWR